MGILFSWLFRSDKTLPSGTMLIVGLDKAGKTSLLHYLKKGFFEEVQPTERMNEEMVKIGNVSIRALDLGGHELVRQIWKEYFVQANIIIFVIDASTTDRFLEAKRELESILSEPSLSQIPILVYGNKIDVAGSFTKDELIQKLQIAPNERIHIEMVSVKQHFISRNSLKWISNQMQ